jgi:hypothetical protein
VYNSRKQHFCNPEVKTLRMKVVGLSRKSHQIKAWVMLRKKFVDIFLIFEVSGQKLGFNVFQKKNLEKFLKKWKFFTKFMLSELPSNEVLFSHPSTILRLSLGLVMSKI